MPMKSLEEKKTVFSKIVQRVGPRGYIRYHREKAQKKSSSRGISTLRNAGISKKKRLVALFRGGSVDSLTIRGNKRQNRQKPWQSNIRRLTGKSHRKKNVQNKPLENLHNNATTVEKNKVFETLLQKKIKETKIAEEKLFNAVEDDVEAAELVRDTVFADAEASASISQIEQTDSKMTPHIFNTDRNKIFFQQESRKHLNAARATNREILARRLRRAVQNGKKGIPSLRVLLPCDDAVNSSVSVGRENDGKTALHVACELNNLEAVYLLLRNKGDMKVKDLQGRYPSDLCKNRGMRALICKHADEERIRNQIKDNPVVSAVVFGHSDLLVELLRNGGNANATEDSSNGVRTPVLHLAVHSGRLDIVNILLAFGADTNTQNDEGKTAQDICRSSIIEQKLINTKKERILNKRKGHDLRDAALHGNLEEAAHILSKYPSTLNTTDSNGRNALHIACKEGSGAIVALLLQCGANPRKRDELLRWTPLHCACAHGHAAIVKLICESQLTRLAELQKNDCLARDLESQDLHFQTPLHLASQVGSAATVAELVRHGAVVSSKDDQGRNCLDVANLSNRDYIEKTTQIKKSIDIYDIYDMDGQTNNREFIIEDTDTESNQNVMNSRDLAYKLLKAALVEQQGKEKVQIAESLRIKSELGTQTSKLKCKLSPKSTKNSKEPVWIHPGIYENNLQKGTKTRIRHPVLPMGSASVPDVFDKSQSILDESEYILSSEETGKTKIIIEQKEEDNSTETNIPTSRQLRMRRLKKLQKKIKKENETKTKLHSSVTTYGKAASDRLRDSMIKLDAINSSRGNIVSLPSNDSHSTPDTQDTNNSTKKPVKINQPNILPVELDEKVILGTESSLGLGLTSASVAAALSNEKMVTYNTHRGAKLPGSISLKGRISLLRRRSRRPQLHHWSERNTFNESKKSSIRFEALQKHQKYRKNKKHKKDQITTNSIISEGLTEVERQYARAKGFKNRKRQIRIENTYPKVKDALVGSGRFTREVHEAMGKAAYVSVIAAIYASGEARTAETAAETAAANAALVLSSNENETTLHSWDMNEETSPYLKVNARESKTLQKASESTVLHRKPKEKSVNEKDMKSTLKKYTSLKSHTQHKIKRVSPAMKNKRSNLKTRKAIHSLETMKSSHRMKGTRKKVPQLHIDSKYNQYQNRPSTAPMPHIAKKNLVERSNRPISSYKHKLGNSKRAKTVVKGYSHRLKLKAFYQKYNPEKVAQVDKILRVYHGRESVLFDKLQSKYYSNTSYGTSTKTEDSQGNITEAWIPWEDRNKTPGINLKYFSKMDNILTLPF